MFRTLTIVALLASMTATGCRADPGRDDATGAARPASPASPAYRPPADPCAAVPAEVAGALTLTKRRRVSTGQFAPNGNGVVSYDLVTCEWVVPNAGQGPQARPNELTAVVSYAVLEVPDGDAAAVAKGVFDRTHEGARDGAGITVVNEAAAPVPADDGYYLYVTRKSGTGAGGQVEVGLRRGNAVVTVEFSGADLALDPARPRGDQLVTTPFDESRLRPTVERMLPGALALLR